MKNNILTLIIILFTSISFAQNTLNTQSKNIEKSLLNLRNAVDYKSNALKGSPHQMGISNNQLFEHSI